MRAGAASRVTSTTGRSRARPERRRSIGVVLAEPDAERARPEVGEPVGELAGGDVRLRHELDDERVAGRPTAHRESGARAGRPRRRARGRERPRQSMPTPTRRRGAPDPRPPRAARAAAARRHGAAKALDDRAHGVLVQVVADAERVGAGLERAHRALLDADAGADRAHLERVGDHEPVEAELLAQQPGQDPSAQRRRQRRRARARAGARSSPPAPRRRSRRGTAAARARGRPRRPAGRGASRPTVSPCPGKCLAQAATPWRCVPSTKAATWRATSSGSAPKLRTPITGLSGFVFTSATGAKFRLTPARASSAAIAAATSAVSAGSSTAPSARLPGNELPPRPRAA